MGAAAEAVQQKNAAACNRAKQLLWQANTPAGKVSHVVVRKATIFDSGKFWNRSIENRAGYLRHVAYAWRHLASGQADFEEYGHLVRKIVEHYDEDRIIIEARAREHIAMSYEKGAWNGSTPKEAMVAELLKTAALPRDSLGWLKVDEIDKWWGEIRIGKGAGKQAWVAGLGKKELIASYPEHLARGILENCLAIRQFLGSLHNGLLGKYIEFVRLLREEIGKARQIGSSERVRGFGETKELVMRGVAFYEICGCFGGIDEKIALDILHDELRLSMASFWRSEARLVWDKPFGEPTSSP